MNQDNTPLHTTEIHRILQICNIPFDNIELYQKNGNAITYLIDSRYILKISPYALNEETKQDIVKSLQLTPKIYSSGSFASSDREYHYVIIDYVQGNDLWSIVPILTDKEKYNIGNEIAQFLNELHSITDDYYDIGHYIPTIPRCGKSWKEGHLDYTMILRNELSVMDLKIDSEKIISEAFDYIYTNIDSLQYQTGAKLLHNDFHPKNIIVREGRLAGIIDWECSQYGEADFELSHLFHWCIYPAIQENNFDVLLKSVVENSRIASIPEMEKRMTIYQLEHELNQLIWRGKSQEAERIHRINGWLNGKVNKFLLSDILYESGL